MGQRPARHHRCRRLAAVALLSAAAMSAACVTRRADPRDVDANMRAKVEADLARRVDTLEREVTQLTKRRDALTAQVTELQRATESQAAAIEAWRFTFGTLYTKAAEWARAAGQQIPPAETMVPKEALPSAITGATTSSNPG